MCKVRHLASYSVHVSSANVGQWLSHVEPSTLPSAQLRFAQLLPCVSIYFGEHPILLALSTHCWTAREQAFLSSSAAGQPLPVSPPPSIGNPHLAWPQAASDYPKKKLPVVELNATALSVQSPFPRSRDRVLLGTELSQCSASEHMLFAKVGTSMKSNPSALNPEGPPSYSQVLLETGPSPVQRVHDPSCIPWQSVP